MFSGGSKQNRKARPEAVPEQPLERDRQRTPGTRRGSPPMSPTPLGTEIPRLTDTPMGMLGDVAPDYFVQTPIPLLQEAINKTYEGPLIDNFRRVINTYPELLPLVTDADQNQGKTLRRIKGSDFDPYLDYTDLEQTYSDPLLRGELYEDLINEPLTRERINAIYLEEGEGMDEATARRELRNYLNDAEGYYTGGSAQGQTIARRLIKHAAGGKDVLSEIETPAFQPRRPLVGGGGYVSPKNSDDYTYISQRAIDYNSALDALEDAGLLESVAREFPGVISKQPNVETEMTFFKNRLGQVSSVPTSDLSPDEINQGYTIRLDRGAPTNRLLHIEDMEYRDLPMSQNALRFLKDNPAFDESLIAYTTQVPGGQPSYSSAYMPPEINREVARFVGPATLRDQRAGTLFTGNPLPNSDLITQRLNRGETPDTSSYLRNERYYRLYDSDQPNIRGRFNAGMGMGPTNPVAGQMAMADARGNIIPLQLFEPEDPLVGSVNPLKIGFPESRLPIGELVKPAESIKGQPRFYQTVVPGVTPEGLRFAADRIKAVPSSLLPGVSDLIPSAEAIRQTYNAGPMAGGSQVVKDFLAGAPVSLGLAPILSSPAVAPLAPGIGAGFVTTAGAEAANELVKQETGKSLAQRVQETAGAVSGDTSLVGTPNRSFARDSNQGRARAAREAERVVNPPTITAGTIRPENTSVDRSDENFLQRRIRLAQEARQRDPGDFGITELLFGR
mgnify:CR=1 FL=1